MRQLADHLEVLNLTVGKAVRWLVLAMVVIQFLIVIMRYVYSISFIALDESVLYMHGMLFMLAAGYTFAVDKHVRVDIFYADFSERGKAMVNSFGHVFLLFPALALVLYYSWPSMRASWAILEGPISTGGIQAVFILKSLIPAFCILLAIQGVSLLLRDILFLRGKGSK